jgi:transglutaminase-like putative cysteine protease
MRYLVRHTTSYEYSEPVSICHNEARLVPRHTPQQRPLASRLVVEPAAPTLTPDTDYFGNTVHFFTLEEAHVRLAVSAVSEVDLTPFEPPALMLSPAWDGVRDRIRRDHTPEGLRALELTLDSPHVRRGQRLIDYAAVSFPPAGRCSTPSSSSPAGSAKTSSIIRAPPRSRHRSTACSRRAAGSARTSPTCRSACCAASGSRRGT